MKICFLYTVENAHIQKWCRYFHEKGHEVHLISVFPGECAYAQVHVLDTKVDSKHASDAKKLDYLMHGKQLKALIDSIQPDIVHAHYLTSYGSMCAFSKVRPFWLSVWGADVYDFPKKSFLHKWLVKYTLSKAAHVLSTSRAMAEETKNYTDKPIGITPFGVDMELFSPAKRTRPADDGRFVIGTVKTLAKKYGIEDILKAAAMVLEQRPEIPLEIRIAGTGNQKEELWALGKTLGLDERISWLGQISQMQAAEEYANMDVAVIPSTLESESFGVSAVEAEACALPVIISRIPGLMEATNPGQTSLVVDKQAPEQIAEKLIWLYDHPEEARAMGLRGRAFANEHYEFNHCFEAVETLYTEALKK
ncbi:MAG: glycosyltransferase family 4 protein [Oscillospiraceae bacterium]|nr:glycosyltransferase family 4 protein [Oscillospiraceae bacterium]